MQRHEIKDCPKIYNNNLYMILNPSALIKIYVYVLFFLRNSFSYLTHARSYGFLFCLNILWSTWCPGCHIESSKFGQSKLGLKQTYKT